MLGDYLLHALSHQCSTKNINDPQQTMCYAFICIIKRLTVYLTEIIDEFVTTNFIDDCSLDDESVIAYPTSKLPIDFPENPK
ncbi:MAG: phenolic acid decarboxylase [Candidatus Malihini olakiniferum]